MFSADFILGHILLFIQMPVIIIPYIDRLHSTMLFWLRPSRQIRPPIYSSKQSKLRKKRVIRFTVVYFFMLTVFVALVVGPVVTSTYPSCPFISRSLTWLVEKILINVTKNVNFLPDMGLIQPHDSYYNNTDTAYWEANPDLVDDGGKEARNGGGATTTKLAML